MTCAVFGECARLELVGRIGKRVGLNSTEGWLLFQLMARANLRGYCWPSLNKLAENSLASFPTVQRSVARLAALDLIEKVLDPAERARLFAEAGAHPRTPSSIYRIKIPAWAASREHAENGYHNDKAPAAATGAQTDKPEVIKAITPGLSKRSPKANGKTKEESKESSLRSDSARDAHARELPASAAEMFAGLDDPPTPPPPSPPSDAHASRPDKPGLPALLTPVATKNTPRARPRPVTVDDPAFRQFWALYPHKMEKQRALRDWNKAICRAAPETIIAALQTQLDARMFRFEERKRWIPYPSTWLNGGGWMNEIVWPEIDLGTAVLWGHGPTPDAARTQPPPAAIKGRDAA